MWRWRWQEKKTPPGRYPVEFMMWNEKRMEGEENIWCNSILQFPLRRSHTHYGWNHEVFIGLEWPKHSAGNSVLHNEDPGQALFIILTSLTPLLSPKTQGLGDTNGWQLIYFFGIIQSLAAIVHTQVIFLRLQDRMKIQKCKTVPPSKGMCNPILLKSHSVSTN